MNRSRNTFVRLSLVGCLAAVVGAPAALSQTPPDNKKKETVLAPPTPPMGKSDIPYWPYITAILLMILVVGVNFIPSKRGHQD